MVVVPPSSAGMAVAVANVAPCVAAVIASGCHCAEQPALDQHVHRGFLLRVLVLFQFRRLWHPIIPPLHRRFLLLRQRLRLCLQPVGFCSSAATAVPCGADAAGVHPHRAPPSAAPASRGLHQGVQ